MKTNQKIDKMAKLSQKWLHLLVPFSNEYNKKFSGSELAKISGIPQRSASRYLSGLVGQNILSFEVRGNNKFYYLDLDNKRTKIFLGLIESYKSFVFSLDTELWRNLERLTGFGTIVLFGSRVKGYSTKDSDIDVVIFAKKTEKLKRVLRSLGKVQAHIIDFKSFEKLVSKKDVLSLEIIKNHVIFGDVNKFSEFCQRYYNG